MELVVLLTEEDGTLLTSWVGGSTKCTEGDCLLAEPSFSFELRLEGLVFRMEGFFTSDYRLLLFSGGASVSCLVTACAGGFYFSFTVV